VIQCDRDGLLYTSIPQNGNWTVQVDGNDTQATLVGNAMVAVELPAGEHTVRFVYQNAAFALGWKVSLLCAVIFSGMVLLVYRPELRHKHGKYEK